MVRKWPLCLHPLLIGTFPILFFYVHNSQRIPPVETVPPAVIVLVLNSLALLVGFAISRDWIRSGVMLSICEVAFFAYGNLLLWLIQKDLSLWIDNGLRHPATGLCLLALLPCLAYRWTRNAATTNKIAKALSVAGLFLIAVNLFNLLENREVLSKFRRGTDSSLTGVNQALSTPDIYYVILDGYPRADVLKTAYGIDNSSFITFLRQNGFVVAEHSRSNYCHTLFSLASSLNFDFVQNLEARWKQPKNLLPLGELINHSRAAAYLKALGYRTIAFSSGVALTEMRDADLVVSPRWCLSQFEYGWLLTTPIGQMRGLCKTLMQAHRRRVLCTFEELPRVAQVSGPKFVFAHILCPHPPFVFQRDGSIPEDTAQFSEQAHFFNWTGSSRDRFKDQVEFVTVKMETALKGILSHSSSPPVVIIQSDHGNGPHWSDGPSSRAGLHERTAILNAYLAPANDALLLYPSISPVNSLPVIFNAYFGARLPLLPDKIYFSPSVEPQDFSEIDPEL